MLQENNSATNELEREVNGEVITQLSHRAKSFQMPTHLVAAEFGEVNVLRGELASNSELAECQVALTIAMEPQGRFAEGWRTGLALDASASMKRAYGRKVEARVDPELLTDYIKQGRLRAYMEDGEPTRKIQREAFAEIQERGYEINYTENILQPLVQDFTAYLAGSLDGTGKTSLIYWGCGKGDEIQVLGEFDADSCQALAITGPASFKLGKTTKLLPAIAYFVDQYREAQRGMYIFLTDGRIDDLEKVKLYTKELALEIAVGKRNYLKLILIGIGNDVDRYQLQELDDFDTGLDIDLWDYKIASEMHNLTQIFAEVVNENQIIAESGSIYDDAGNCVKTYTNGLPAKVDFTMRDDSQWFELEVGNQRIRQSIVLGAVAIAPLVKKQLFDFEIKASESRNAALFEDGNEKESEADHTSTSHPWWKWLAAVFIGAAFIGTVIAFGILIKRSDDTKLQNLSTSTVNKETETNPQTTNRVNSQPSNNVSKSNLNSSKPTDNSSNNSTNKSQTFANSSDQQKSVADNIATSSNKSQTSVSSNNQQLAKTFNDIQTTKATSSVLPSPNELQLDKSDSGNKSASSPVNNFVKMAGELAEKNSLNNFLKLSSTNSMNNSLKELNNSPSNLNNNLGKQPSDNSSNNTEKNIASKSINDSSKNSVSTNSSSSANNNSANSNARNSDRNISTSILPITNPDLEVTIFFPSDEAQLMTPEETKIDNFWSKIQGRRGIIQVSGHTDKTGDYAYNLDLSQARANEVVRLLRDRGLDNNYKITFEALSWLQPLRKNNTAIDNAFNRRVVIQFKEQR
ncbi:OmpA family protein [Pseudanabaena sp. ABRG5-3]|uniref:OmpA family protein n=1 Tax=Pseudanabaena sp. ABRG5-3 TaxID=685565 RepID=UPI000DC71A03|nr:OmpA family protein [Pseudanabaena sp. ABRG5-3]BBC25892.1 hypothetical protein ABRG53_3635 [Pseudanabaena sp. ABRG5-3]